jgi:hypothetical protein
MAIAITIANKPEKDTKDALKPYNESSDTANVIIASTNKRGRKVLKIGL